MATKPQWVKYFEKLSDAIKYQNKSKHNLVIQKP